MKKIFLIFTLILFDTFIVFSQNRYDLEKKRNKTLKEITYIDSILKTTKSAKDRNINDLKILSNKVLLREKVLRNINAEISLLNRRIDNNNLAIDLLQSDLNDLKADYRKSIVNAYILDKLNNAVIFIISAKDFNQSYKRLKYLRQISKYRREEAELIQDLINEIGIIKLKLQNDLNDISVLKQKELSHTRLLKEEKQDKNTIVRNLERKESSLRKQIRMKSLLAKQIEKEIKAIIERETSGKSVINVKLDKEFSNNRGLLPWPVDKGIVTSKFGKHQHAVIKSLTEDNIGIEITSMGLTPVKSVFNGQVSAITSITGSNMTVIIRHGNYLSVYNNLVNVSVKKGDQVITGQKIGEVFINKSKNESILKFMIFHEKQYQNPEDWLMKK